MYFHAFRRLKHENKFSWADMRYCLFVYAFVPFEVILHVGRVTSL